MAEYFGPWLPSAYFGGGYWRQTGEPSASFADMAALVTASGSLSGTAEAVARPAPAVAQTRPPFAIIGAENRKKSQRKLWLEQQKAEEVALEAAIVALALELV